MLALREIERRLDNAHRLAEIVRFRLLMIIVGRRTRALTSVGPLPPPIQYHPTGIRRLRPQKVESSQGNFANIVLETLSARSKHFGQYPLQLGGWLLPRFRTLYNSNKKQNKI
ncbi:hypothetical protein [Paracraurococcus lichenis]|uniref:Uncharacterized protein n=1 Tax=Paracraurococcus lichenis TaxID=3064888 RepID=A0ABT9EAR4_9PROT|nr:hypothetical protein [Paracraurococcus sp. LOR1-02]MDO9713150.1 hypothetical protein [Paracraurococcus sp. LOR1-02]